MNTKDNNLEIVIIGLGASGLYAIKSALSYNRNHHVTIIEKQDFDQFSPCGLPFVIEGVVKSFDELKHTVPDFKNKLTKYLSHKALSINSENKTVSAVDLASSEKKIFHYDSLILATGATPVNLPVPGASDFVEKGVHFVSNIKNSRDLLNAAKKSKKKRAVVVGGGAIGTEIALALRKIFLDVVIIEKMESLFLRSFDPDMSRLIVDEIERLGIRIMFEKEIESINGDNFVSSVTFSGEKIDCDIVVMAAGMHGNTELAETSGATVENNLVIVDNRMETSVKDIYATGDLVRTYSRIDRTPAVMQLATSAYRQGITAGINAAGGNTFYPGVLNTFLTKVGKLETAGTGYTLATAKSLGYNAKAVSTKREIRPHFIPGSKELKLRVVIDVDNARILGAQAVGEEGAGSRINIFALAIHGGMTLYDLQDTEMCYHPAISQMYDPVSQLAEVGLKRLKLPPRECTKVFIPE